MALFEAHIKAIICHWFSLCPTLPSVLCRQPCARSLLRDLVPQEENACELFVLAGPSTGLASELASFLGGIRSFCRSKSLASSKLVILWLGLNPWRAPMRLVFPPERAPRGRAPVGVKPFNCSTCSDSSLSTEKTLAIFPIALILFLITSFLC